MVVIRVITVLVWLSVFSRGLGESSPESREEVYLEDVLDMYWNWRLELVPEFAIATGNRGRSNRLESFTPEAFRLKQRRCVELLELVSRIDVGALSWHEQTQLRVLEYELATVREGFRWSSYNSLNTVNALEGIHHDFSYWLDALQLETEQDFTDYTSKLRALATQIHEQISLLEEAVRTGWTNHAVSMESVEDSLAALTLTQPVATPFYRPLNDSLLYTSMSLSKIRRLQNQVLNVIQDHVMPAYQKLHHFIQKDYIPSTRASVSISSLPGGDTFYRACLRWYLSYDIIPLDLHNMGQIIVSNLMTQINKMKTKLGYNGHIQNFMKYAHAADIFFYNSGQAMLDKYKSMVHKEALPKLSKLFNNYQVPNIQVQPMMFDGPLGIMMPGSEDQLMPSVFFVNINNPNNKPKWKMKAVTLHEVVPGRYLQVSYERNQSLPEFRQWREYRKMYSVPFQFPFYTAYTEGWAMYAEYLGRELDLLLHPLDAFGQLYSELYKACELVVDTGIHAIGWSQEDAVDFISSRTGAPYDQTSDTVTRIVTLPGQASAPLYGYLKIKELRQRATFGLREEFNIKTFHDLVLSLGPVPLRHLEDEVDAWISGGNYRSGSEDRFSNMIKYQLLFFICIIDFVYDLFM